MAAPEWSRVTNTTLRRYVRGAIPTLLRNQKLLALLEKKGRIEYDKSGISKDWKMEYNRAAVEGNLGNTAVSFEAVDRFQVANLEPRGMLAKDSMTKRDYQMNRGREAIINYFKEMAPRLMKDMRRTFGVLPWTCDGNLAANAMLIHGLPSMLQSTGPSVFLTGGVTSTHTFATADAVIAPNDTYAGISTALGAYTGAWSGLWPCSGSGDDSFDFASPILVNYQSSAFSGTATFAANAIAATRFMLTATQKDSSPDGIVDMIDYDRDLYRQFKAQFDQYQKVEISTNTPLRAMGFNTLSFDGCEITDDFGIPAGMGYAINADQISLESWQKELFGVEGPTWDMQSRTWRTLVDFLGNMFFTSPKYFGRLYAYTDVSGVL
jgi:hypothetical protein